jgi:hypothetical protein
MLHGVDAPSAGDGDRTRRLPAWKAGVSPLRLHPRRTRAGNRTRLGKLGATQGRRHFLPRQDRAFHFPPSPVKPGEMYTSPAGLLVAPKEGFEPSTPPLTAACSTVELLRNIDTSALGEGLEPSYQAGNNRPAYHLPTLGCSLGQTELLQDFLPECLDLERLSEGLVLSLDVHPRKDEDLKMR